MLDKTLPTTGNGSRIGSTRPEKEAFCKKKVIREDAEAVNIEERLEHIEEWLQSHRPDYYEVLEPPASDDALKSAEERFGVELSLAFKSLYRWHGGQRPREFTPLLFNLTFMTLPEVIEAKETLDHVANCDQWQEDSWWPNWIPFLDNGGGDHLCFDLGGFNTGNTNQLLWFDHETHEHEIVHGNLDEFLNDLYSRMVSDDLNLG